MNNTRITANGKYSYDEVHRGKTLEKWVEGAHAYVSDKNGWLYQPLVPYTFGFDNFSCSLAHAFEILEILPNITLNELAAYIHQGWVENYTWWRDNPPWLVHAHYYKAPYSPLGDDRRNKCATLSFSDLPPDEQEKDFCVARYIIESLGSA